MINTTRIAILDMYNGVANEGLRCVKEIVESHAVGFEFKVFDVRQYKEIPDLSFDMYIFSGGPGNPHETEDWGDSYFSLIDNLLDFNRNSLYKKKYGFFICHSFQMLCKHLLIADVTLRNKPTFGIFPIHKTLSAFEDDLLEELSDPFFAVDSRDWQVTNPNFEKMEEMGVEILALEKIREHVEFERALMAVKFTPEFYGTQFHPEADVEGMLSYFMKPEKKAQIIEHHGIGKYEQMLSQLNDPEKIKLTHTTILPNFLELSIKAFQEA